MNFFVNIAITLLACFLVYSNFTMIGRPLKPREMTKRQAWFSLFFYAGLLAWVWIG